MKKYDYVIFKKSLDRLIDDDDLDQWGVNGYRLKKFIAVKNDPGRYIAIMEREVEEAN